MSIEALILGTLHAAAENRTSKAGRPFVTAKVRAAAGDDNAVFVNVIAFSETACSALLALEAGDSLALGGTLKPGAWIDREGNARPQVDLIASVVMTAYALARKRKTVQSDHDDRPPRRGFSGAPADNGFEADDAWLREGAA